MKREFETCKCLGPYKSRKKYFSAICLADGRHYSTPNSPVEKYHQLSPAQIILTSSSSRPNSVHLLGLPLRRVCGPRFTSCVLSYHRFCSFVKEGTCNVNSLMQKLWKDTCVDWILMVNYMEPSGKIHGKIHAAFWQDPERDNHADY